MQLFLSFIPTVFSFDEVHNCYNFVLQLQFVAPSRVFSKYYHWSYDVVFALQSGNAITAIEKLETLTQLQVSAKCCELHKLQRLPGFVI